MDIKLAKEIYGSAWFMDSITFSTYINILNDHRAGVIEAPKEKLNSFTLYDLKSKQKIVGNNWDLNDLDENEKAISIIKLDGVITKNGGASHNGTKELSQFLTKADSNSSIEGHILHISSGGGSSNAVKIMADAMDNTTKPIVVFAEDVMASAALGIGSHADYIFAESERTLVGSIGTMIEFAGYPSKNENKETGLRNVRIYASQSTRKNYEFEQAINEFNFEPIKSKILDPTAQVFINRMKNNRPNIKEEQLTGEIFNASEVVGSLIDEIGNFDKAINKINELNQQKMGLFNKEKPLNTVVFNDVEAAYQGELKEGTELIPLNGGKLENGVYQKDGMDYTIENSKLTKVQETPAKSYTQEELDNTVAPLNAKIDELTKSKEALEASNTELNETINLKNEEIETLKNKVADLEDIKSGHTPPKKDNEENETKPVTHKEMLAHVNKEINEEK
jgi:ClpP class serine protease